MSSESARYFILEPILKYLKSSSDSTAPYSSNFMQGIYLVRNHGIQHASHEDFGAVDAAVDVDVDVAAVDITGLEGLDGVWWPPK